MLSGKRPTNCTPCAKRKVRCDKGQPCGHCKRRKGDICVYPAQRTGGPDSGPDDDSQRIEKLESYIRRLGGDPHLAKNTVESGEADVETPSTNGPTSKARPTGDTASLVHSTDKPWAGGSAGKQSGLVEHDEQVTYIEAYLPTEQLQILGTLLMIPFQTNVV